ncbi:MAG: hypothetical protein JXR96_08335 [Deltaproteobacteria bacterium]|nr:hypothetical protein [Deltaproteobacteria bacterium]
MERSLPLRHPRLVAYQEVIRTLRDSVPVWTGFLSRLPLTLGESDVDRVAPYSLDDASCEALARAVDGLADLLKRRHDPDYDREKKKALLPDERKRVVLWPRRFCPRTLPEEGPLRDVVRKALLETPDLDAGLLESWLSKQAGGRALYSTLTDLLAKSLRASRLHPQYSGLGLMIHLALLDSLLQAKDRIKSVKVRNMSYERLDHAVGTALHACFQRAVEEALAQEGSAPEHSPYRVDLVVIMASLGPLHFFSILPERFGEDINPYGLPAEIAELLNPIYRAALEQGNDPQGILSRLMRTASIDSPLRLNLIQHAACESLRRAILDHLLASEDPAFESDRLLAAIYGQNGELIDLMNQHASLALIAAELEKRLADPRKLEASRRANRRLHKAVAQIRDDGPDWMRAGEPDRTGLQDLLERFVLQQMDEFSLEHIRKARQRVVDRRRSNSVQVLVKEYESGRLYRIALDDKPTVRSRIAHEEAQLFVDLKGYTSRTARAKELVMAEFLKSEFYEPILEAAKRYYAGASLVSREQNIQLVNLVGDAVAFSGNIVSLVSLARDIQQVFRSYHDKLLRLSPEDEQSSFERLRSQVQQKQSQIRQEMQRLREELKEIKKEVFDRSALDDAEKVRQLQLDYRQRFDRIQDRHQELRDKQAKTKDASERAQIAARLDALRKAHAELKRHRVRTLEALKGMKGEQLGRHLTDLLCRDQLEKTRIIEQRLRTMEDQSQSLGHALEEEYRRRMGFGLEAGLFIAYGTAAESIEIDDDIWGSQRVAISEHVNQAARGTARNVFVKQQLDEMLESERRKRGQPELEFPFRIHIAPTSQFSLEPRIHRLWSQAVSGSDRGQLDRFLASLDTQVRDRFEQLTDPDSLTGTPISTDIYNLGEAISGSALDAYLQATRHSHFFFRIQVRPEELAEEIQQRYCFPDPVLSLIAGRRLREPDEVEIFRYVGQVVFRGFEISRPTSVFEILRSKSTFFQDIRTRHFEAWWEEAQQDPSGKVERLGVELENAVDG